MTDVVPGPPYPGVYQHYKGDLYVVHGIITDSTNSRSGTIVVLYESLKYKELHVREIREFTEMVHEGQSRMFVHSPDPYCEICTPRFKLLTMGS
jgi:hypothetical protein